MLREERELCYKHRDAYYEAIKREIEETNNKKDLKRLKALFEKNCPKSWVEHFEKIREDSEKFTKLTTTTTTTTTTK